MGELKYRAQINTTIPIEMIEQIDEIHNKTQIPKSRLAEEAWGDLLKKRKYQKYIKKKGPGK